MKRIRPRPLTTVVVLLVAIVFASAAILYGPAAHSTTPPGATHEETPERTEADTRGSASNAASVVEFPHSLWASAGLEVQPATRQAFADNIQLTGKVMLNEDRLAHVFPLVEGRVEEVHVHLGQHVKEGEPLVLIQSQEVGQRMLQLFQDRLKLSFAKVKSGWTEEVVANTLALIKRMREDASVENIEAEFKDRTIGDYREQLMTAYVGYLKAKHTYVRLMPLSRDGAIAGRQLIEAEADRDATRAALQSLFEQVSQDAAQARRMSSHSVEETATAAAVSEASLRILGFSVDDLQNINPSQQGEQLAHYEVAAPFDGTIIRKDVVLLERVSPDRQMLTIADLSSVWITADVYEAHLPLLAKLRDQSIQIHSESWPDREFKARVFYTGDVVQETTRTVALHAMAKNVDGLLKPGMFVTVKLPSLEDADVLQVPETAIQDFEGQKFAFVQTSDESFERRDLQTGRHNRNAVEILAGLESGDRVVTQGGFALKSKLLESLLEE